MKNEIQAQREKKRQRLRALNDFLPSPTELETQKIEEQGCASDRGVVLVSAVRRVDPVEPWTVQPHRGGTEVEQCHDGIGGDRLRKGPRQALAGAVALIPEAEVVHQEFVGFRIEHHSAEIGCPERSRRWNGSCVELDFPVGRRRVAGAVGSDIGKDVDGIEFRFREPGRQGQVVGFRAQSDRLAKRVASRHLQKGIVGKPVMLGGDCKRIVRHRELLFPVGRKAVTFTLAGETTGSCIQLQWSGSGPLQPRRHVAGRGLDGRAGFPRKRTSSGRLACLKSASEQTSSRSVRPALTPV